MTPAGDSDSEESVCLQGLGRNVYKIDDVANLKKKNNNQKTSIKSTEI